MNSAGHRQARLGNKALVWKIFAPLMMLERDSSRAGGRAVDPEDTRAESCGRKVRNQRRFGSRIQCDIVKELPDAGVPRVDDGTCDVSVCSASARHVLLTLSSLTNVSRSSAPPMHVPPTKICGTVRMPLTALTAERRSALAAQSTSLYSIPADVRAAFACLAFREVQGKLAQRPFSRVRTVQGRGRAREVAGAAAGIPQRALARAHRQ